MQKYISPFCGFALILGFTNFTFSQIYKEKREAIAKTQIYVSEIVQKSFPKIKLAKIRIKTFKSETNFFKARFSFTRFLTFQRMRHLLYVNPEVYRRNAPEDSVKAILAHELAHILYYTKKNRFELLGLASLASNGFSAKFERKADLEAVARGYGEGLIQYRRWLYRNIPSNNISKKKRSYFSPQEIQAMLDVLKVKPEMIDVWRKRVPLNVEEIKGGV